MAKSKTKPVPGAKRTQGTHERKIAAGLRLIKIYVADQTPTPGDTSILNGKTEADRIRAYAAKQPETKKLLAEALL